MIRHHDERDDVNASSVEMMERRRDLLRAPMAAQNARTMMGVEPFFDPARETTMLFAFHIRAPRQRMPLEPGIPLFLPSLKQVSRKRISQSKRDEINRSILLPMRETVLRDANVVMRVEQFHGTAVLYRRSAPFRFR
jgi:hypothetical protein